MWPQRLQRKVEREKLSPPSDQYSLVLCGPCSWSESNIYWKCDKRRQIMMGSLTWVEVLHFMSMTCQVKLPS